MMFRLLPTFSWLTLVMVLNVLVFSSSPVLAAHHEHILHEARFDAKDLQWELLADGTHQLTLLDGRRLDITDEPDLPAVNLVFLVPADQVITSVRIEPLSVRSEALPGPLSLAAPKLTSTGEQVSLQYLLPVNGVFPADWATFGGLHDWRGYRLLAVTVYPARLHHATDQNEARLEYLEHFAIYAVTASELERPDPITRERKVEGEREQLEQSLRQLVANPGAIAGYPRAEGALLDKLGGPFLPTPNPSLEGSGVRYLIVTSADLADEFQRLADHRTAQGLPAQVVTREWIEATQRRGMDFQETLRMYLQQAYSKWGVEFLLLGGDTGVIPTRFVRSTFFSPAKIIPTDRYYACLDGNWNANGNGWLAETATAGLASDDADLAPELAIGRVPVQSPLGVQQFVDKVIAYETTAAGASYANRILFAAERLFSYLDGAVFPHELNEEIIQPYTDMIAMRMYETDTYPHDMVLTVSAFIQQVNTGNYGQVNHFGHGHYYNMHMANGNFTSAHANALTNGPNYFLMFGLNCSAAAFDVACVSGQLVTNPHGGSVVSIGSAREALPYNAFFHQKAFYEYMVVHGMLRAGLAVNAALMQFIGETHANTLYRWTHLNMVTLGDPSTSIWCGSPVQPQISAPQQVAVGEQTVQVTVTVDGEPVPGADVCLAKDGETYARAVTNAEGIVSLHVIPKTDGAMILTVSGAGLAWTTQEISVNGSATYVRLKDVIVSDTSGNGNGLPEAGETLSLQLQLQDVGGAGASGVNVVVTSDHPDLTVLSGSSTVPNIPPGGTVMAHDPIVVQTPATLRDGTSVRLRVTVTASGGGSWVSQGEIEILAPEPEMVRLVIDGVLENNQQLVLWPFVKNYGAGRLDQLFIQIVDPAPGVVINEGNAMILGLGLLAEETYHSGALSLTLDDISMTEPARLTFTDNYGRSFSQPLEFNPPTSPPLPVADATLASDAIALRWDSVGEDRTLGYHVYRATEANGPFVRANQDLLRRVSYFEDQPLDQLTSYWYKVTAVDTFFVESPYSPIVAQGTMPAELGNFPLTFKTQTSSHLAVGDVTGDGQREIVLAGDEVYVWRADGTEVLDGDGDAQTTGPFTNIGGAFSPAGVVLAHLDNQPGLEIIVSLLSPSPQIHIYRADGTMLPGWPRSLLGSWNWATPAVGDVTGDGFNEVVVNDLAGRTFVWRHDGTELMDGDNDPNTDGVFVVRPEEWGFSSPALYDLDGDGAREIIFGTKYGNDQNALLAYKSDGNQAPGFPFMIGTPRIICSPAIADLDGSGTKEIIFFGTNRRLYVLRANGTLIPGFPVHHNVTGDDNPGPSPGVGDVTGDGNLEIVWPVNKGGNLMDLLLVDITGAILDGWPVQLSSRTEGSPVVGDINGDGIPDIIQPTEDGYIHAFNADGTPIPGFPIRLNGPCRTTPVICDLNNDGYVNLVYGSGDLMLHAWTMPYEHNPGHVPWPTFQGNNQRTGEARIVSVTSVADPDLPTVFTVLPPYPNPFNPMTTIRLYVAPETSAALEVAVFDLRGRRVRQLHTGAADAGWQQLTWDGSDDGGRRLGSGIYFVQARQAEQTQTFKLTLVK